ncbi:MAG: AraC family transcriptional regulator [Thermoanaerobaculia bacterium]|nr:AraC family transcriptional regulator [Thermoanaerobaculia bacterium]
MAEMDPDVPDQALGDCVRSHAGTGWLAFESLQPAGLEVDEHAHDLVSICAVLGGSYETSDGGRFVAGDLVIAPAGEAVALRFGEAGARCLLLETSQDLWQRGANAIESEILELHREKALFGAVVRLSAELASGTESPCPVTESGCFDVLFELSNRCIRPQACTGRGATAQALEAIHDGFSQPLSLSAVADHVGVHRMTLARSFRTVYGLSVGQYIQRLRVFEACRLIQRGSPLADAALEAGFSDQSHMTRVFGRALGRTPAALRNLCS